METLALEPTDDEFDLQRIKMEDQKETISLEELVDKERGALVGRDLNKITLESFLKWKKRKIEEKKSKAKDEAKKRKQEMDSGNLSKLTGMFLRKGRITPCGNV